MMQHIQLQAGLILYRPGSRVHRLWWTEKFRIHFKMVLIMNKVLPEQAPTCISASSFLFVSDRSIRSSDQAWVFDISNTLAALLNYCKWFWNCLLVICVYCIHGLICDIYSTSYLFLQHISLLHWKVQCEIWSYFRETVVLTEPVEWDSSEFGDNILMLHLS